MIDQLPEGVGKSNPGMLATTGGPNQCWASRGAEIGPLDSPAAPFHACPREGYPNLERLCVKHAREIFGDPYVDARITPTRPYEQTAKALDSV